MAIEIILPKSGNLFCAAGSKIFADGVELKDVISFGMEQTGIDDIVHVTLKIPVTKISHSE